MASDLIGRCACPECGFHAAHVKIKTDKEGAHPYRHCPDCSAQYFTRSTLQAANLRKMMRPATPAPGQTPTPDPVPAPAAAPVKVDPPAPPKKKGLFAELAGVLDD